ncbi:putative coatomer delta subunit-like proteindelta-COP putativedelta-coat protein [Leptomonas pyrrhocoris]|uniref:Coatomer subunit delta n=1 Tax=Leptomonas pyrrhocoris TaxID=157538 RepID=A0A0M9FXP1_LEPPY|nr:putative coatomer delta subunit-like proteindelta-COP putativedelta-coat protein [Leptomonas pyrrhocoris]XP_015656446.1 putative coatomer delta subunit-like proteindelta-COP putativedelta-coat protein [Leptomonas pyrrhocoris]XP_015656447.1 putative coatomer delta subunit-like proteindelta-COP putativedelta-coat protein [Leptomonas pyrrhocoris]XP_015656448.1 putative coatomer delta subunit-like proteindelta-COP putativedelta-coat protein [Leptomonas pyrrhocoris]KPA78006.1 putative coatomer de|eukprot:XP_015656445.1 putative coatomer delta subunit-like proteindelta-COP putativedelta-coat protein [Leptomonas pyrrhocoris]
MTVISAGVVSKQGRIVLARQFTDISRVRVEGLLSAFPRLLDSSVNKQVTYIDAGSVRYVYQPVEDLFLVLVTTTKSNIVEDLETLHLMGRLLPEYVPEGVTEANLELRAFEVFFALDEVVVCGKRGNSTVEQIRTYLEMDSYDERMALEEKQRQMEEARKITAEHARKMRERKMGGGPTGGAYGGISSEDPNYGGFGASSSSGAAGSMSMYAGGGAGGVDGTFAAPASSTSMPVTAAAAPRSGMSLGKARKTDISSKIQKEMGVTALSVPLAAGAGQQPPSMDLPVTAAAAAQEAVNIIIEEKMSAALSRDGEPAAVDIKGELTVTVTDPQCDHVKLMLTPVSDAFTFRAHAKVNKALFASDQVLTMADGKAFPVQQPVTILRWRQSSGASTPAPINFTCWPEQSSITIEYELADPSTPPLRPVRLAIPLYGTTPQAVQPSCGTCQVIAGEHVIWTMDVVEGHQNASGHIEISVDSDQGSNGEELFFPVQVALSSEISVAHVGVSEVVSTQNGQAVRFSQQSRLITDHVFVQ